MRPIDSVKNYIMENLLYGDESRRPSESDSFLESGVLDSTAMMELVSYIEESFGIRIEDDELIPENIDSLMGLERFLDAKLGQEV